MPEDQKPKESADRTTLALERIADALEAIVNDGITVGNLNDLSLCVVEGKDNEYALRVLKAGD